MCNILDQAFEIVYTEATMQQFQESIDYSEPSSQPHPLSSTPLPFNYIVRDNESALTGDEMSDEMLVI